MQIEIKVLNKEFYRDYENETSIGEEIYSLPKYATPNSAALDLISTKDWVLYPGESKMIPTGLAIYIGSSEQYRGEMSYGVAGLVLPRSGLGAKGLILGNTIGLIDEDYQGELKVSVWNRNTITPGPSKNVSVRAGERFAQLMFVPILKPTWNLVEEFSTLTDRAAGGFGSTGT